MQKVEAVIKSDQENGSEPKLIKYFFPAQLNKINSCSIDNLFSATTN